MMLYDVEVRFGNTAQDEVFNVGQILIRCSACWWWRCLLRDICTETDSDAKNSPTTRLRCDLLLRLALLNLGPLAARRVPQSACCAA